MYWIRTGGWGFETDEGDSRGAVRMVVGMSNPSASASKTPSRHEMVIACTGYPTGITVGNPYLKITIFDFRQEKL